jgi:hypothetical protein
MPNLTNGELNRVGAVITGVPQGTATVPVSLGTTAKSAEQLYFSTSATSGSSRVVNARLYFNAAGEGEALRGYGIVNNATAAVGGTVNGAHITLGVTGASGAVSGAGNAIRATLSLGANTTAGGTLSAIQLDSDFDNAATVPATASCIRVTNTNTKLWANLMTIPAPVNGSIFAAHTTQTMTQSIRILGATGTPYYIMCTDAATNRS